MFKPSRISFATGMIASTLRRVSVVEPVLRLDADGLGPGTYRQYSFADAVRITVLIDLTEHFKLTLGTAIPMVNEIFDEIAASAAAFEAAPSDRVQTPGPIVVFTGLSGKPSVEVYPDRAACMSEVSAPFGLWIELGRRVHWSWHRHHNLDPEFQKEKQR